MRATAAWEHLPAVGRGSSANVSEPDEPSLQPRPSDPDLLGLGRRRLSCLKRCISVNVSHLNAVVLRVELARKSVSVVKVHVDTERKVTVHYRVQGPEAGS